MASSLAHIVPYTSPPDSAKSKTPLLLTPTTRPIPLLAGPITKAYSAAHTAGVLIYYYFRASSLVADPLSTLIQDLLPIAALQALFCGICVPSFGSWVSGTGVSDAGSVTATAKGAKGSASTSSSSSPGIGRKKPGKINAGTSAMNTSAGVSGGPLHSRAMAFIFSLILTFTVPPVPLALIAMVLGAPLYPMSLLPHTGALALHVALLGFLPIFYAHGVSASAWRDVTAAWLPFDEAGVWSGAVGCMIGGWVGAIPIALDWDREWQKWPCTVVWGSVLGWGVVRTVTGMLRLGIGRRIDLSEGKGMGTLADEQTSAQALERKEK